MKLAGELALRNRELTEPEINAVVREAITRLIFLRICEERGIEPLGPLHALLDKRHGYVRMCDMFRAASPEAQANSPVIDHRALQDIFHELRDPQCPYRLSRLGAGILGQVYEHSLSKVLRLARSRRAVVEEKSAAKKAGGVYYTPNRIVDSVVRHTVGELLEGKAPQEAAGVSANRNGSQQLRPLALLDPACGGGWFLLGAYRFLLDWHRDWYIAHGPSEFKDRIDAREDGPWRLTFAERKRILLDHIYGVDVDPQAVEVTKLSLLLELLEGETRDGRTPESFALRKELADLAGSIKCGNSLVGPDFYDDERLDVREGESPAETGAFDWQAEFPAIMQCGGFDAVIGNPPWGQKAVASGEAEVRYLRRKYPSVRGIFDWFRPFVEQGLRLLVGGGYFGMVLPDIVLLKNYPDTRKCILDDLALSRIDWWGRVFSSAVIDAATVIGRKAAVTATHRVNVAVHDSEAPLSHEIPQADFRQNARYTFNLHLTTEKRSVLTQLEQLPKLGDFFEIHEGAHSGNMRAELFLDEKVDDTCRPLYFGRDEIRPYSITWHGKFIRLGAVPAKKTRDKYANTGKPCWHENPKVLVRRTGDWVLAAVDGRGYYCSNNFFLVFPRGDCPLSLHGLCTLLNSRALTWYFRAIEPRKGRVFAELKIKHLAAFPLPAGIVDGGCEDLNRLGEQRAELERCLNTGVEAPHEAKKLECSRAAVDNEINRCAMSAFALDQEIASRWSRLMEEDVKKQ